LKNYCHDDCLKTQNADQIVFKKIVGGSALKLVSALNQYLCGSFSLALWRGSALFFFWGSVWRSQVWAYQRHALLLFFLLIICELS
jgi:hypothetical protein